MQSKFELIHTDDGSHTVRDVLLDVTYHSTHGAVAESAHVFIDHGLKHSAAQLKQPVRILEVGFGTGLNALLAYRFAVSHMYQLDYTALEPFPLPASITDRLNYPETLGQPKFSEVFSGMHRQSTVTTTQYGSYFTLSVFRNKLEGHTTDTPYDLVFLDAFGPTAAPELWSLPSLDKLKSMLSQHAVLVTFCAQGQFKRNLKSLGFRVESLPGPPGKREMTRATLL